MNQFQESYIVPILNQVRPKKILEIGILEGRHTYALLKWCQSMDCELTSIDPTPWIGNIPEEYKPGAVGFLYKRGHHSEKSHLLPRHIEKIFSEGLNIYWTCIKSLSLTFLAECKDKYDVAFIDGDHNYYTVINELTFLAKLLSQNSVVFIHDVTNPSCAYKDYYYDFTLIPEAFSHKDKQGIVNAVHDFIEEFPEFTYRVLTDSENGLGLIKRCIS